jgi:carboxyl-terminal processing protease
LFLFIALSLPAIIYSQQGKSTTRAGSPERAAGSKTAPGGKSVTAAVVKNDLSEALSIIQENYIDGQKLDYNSVFKSSINGMLSVLDPHSTYFDPVEFAAFKTEQRSEYFGIGATIGDLRQDDSVNTYIRATFQDAPAARAGLRFGDRILEVDGQSMRGKTYPEVRKFLIGPRGTKVKVTVQHAATGKVETVEITRDAVSLPSIPQAYMVKPGVGYVAMTGGFNLTTADEFKTALTDLHSKGMNQLVLDLRGNRGGLLIQAVRVADQFLQRGQLIVTQKGRIQGSSDSFTALNEDPDTTPLVVLVNDQTASAAEIVAGALQDHDRALVVGSTSFGKGLVQTLFPLDGGYALKITTAKWYTPSGRSIQRERKFVNGKFVETTPDSLETEAKKKARPAYRSDAGRVVYGGGGITPDILVRDDTLTTAEQTLIKAIAPKQQDVYVTLADYALELSRGAKKDFKVQPQWRDEFYRRLTAKGVVLDRAQYASAGRYVDRLLEQRVARLVAGDSTAKRRDLPSDAPLRKAVEVMEKGQSQRDLFTIAAATRLSDKTTAP